MSVLSISGWKFKNELTVIELPVLPLLHDDVDERDGEGGAEEAGQKHK